MIVTYTSKRRHKPDVYSGSELLDLTAANWVAGNSATLSNDANGYLKVTYNAVANPYAYRTITTVAGTVYRLSIECVDDGTTNRPEVMVGLSATIGELFEYVFEGNEGTVTTYFKAVGTTTVFTLGNFVTSSGSATYSKISLRAVSALTHAPVNVLVDDISNSAAVAYTAVSATLSGANNLFGSVKRDDNALKLTNVGAVNGEARRTYSFTTISGRQYKASALFVPHTVSGGRIHIGESFGSQSLGGYELKSSVNASDSFFTAGQNLRWEFSNTLDGWTLANATNVNAATYTSITATTNDPQLIRTGISFSGYDNRYVAMRIKRTTAGTWTQPLEVFYTTAQHGFGPNYAVAQVATFVNGEYTIVVWDMWQLVVGGNDWKDSTITGLRVDITGTSGATFDVDWIVVGNLNPLALTFTAKASSTYLSLYNREDANGVGYYILPHVEQLDSEYTLTKDTAQADQSYPDVSSRNISLDGTVETIFQNESEIWTVTTSTITSKSELDDWLEFASSCKAGEQFTVDLWEDGELKNCILEGSPSVQRVSDHNTRFTFSYRVTGDAS